MKKDLYKLFFGGTAIIILVLSCFILYLLLETTKRGKGTKELDLMKSEKLITTLYLKQNIQEAIINDNLYVNLYPKDSVNNKNNNKPVLYSDILLSIVTSVLSLEIEN